MDSGFANIERLARPQREFFTEKLPTTAHRVTSGINHTLIRNFPIFTNVKIVESLPKSKREKQLGRKAVRFLADQIKEKDMAICVA
jgi:hypothetical protein